MEQPHTLDTQQTQPDTRMPLALALARVTRRLKLAAQHHTKPRDDNAARTSREARRAHFLYVQQRLRELAALERRYGK